MAWRMTMMSGFMASMLRAVSDSVSPFCTALVDAEMFNVSAERRFAAISKEVRVRVDGSKNRFTTVLPLRVGTFLISLLLISFMLSAVFRRSSISSAVRSSNPRMSLCLNPMGDPPEISADVHRWLPAGNSVLRKFSLSEDIPRPGDRHRRNAPRSFTCGSWVRCVPRNRRGWGVHGDPGL